LIHLGWGGVGVVTGRLVTGPVVIGPVVIGPVVIGLVVSVVVGGVLGHLNSTPPTGGVRNSCRQLRCKHMPAYSVSPNMLRKRIREHREARGYSQEAFARRAGLGEKYYQNFEAGRRDNPTIQVLNKIAEALEVHVVELLGEPDEIQKLRKLESKF
jgi:DNA-binding XRE family transcriptional regulator